MAHDISKVRVVLFALPHDLEGELCKKLHEKGAFKTLIAESVDDVKSYFKNFKAEAFVSIDSYWQLAKWVKESSPASFAVLAQKEFAQEVDDEVLQVATISNVVAALEVFKDLNQEVLF